MIFVCSELPAPRLSAYVAVISLAYRNRVLQPGVRSLYRETNYYGAARDMGVNFVIGWFRCHHPCPYRSNTVSPGLRCYLQFSIVSAATSPLITALSIVAGSPVPVQSPARIKFEIDVRGPGLKLSDSTVCESVASRSFT